MKSYMMQTVAYTEDNGTEVLSDKFVFDAKDEKDADTKAFGWSRYHSYCYREDVRFREATENEREHNLHNEYIS